ncbi:hypothetical protein KCU83_g4744, partial [Aureobasidium melanogenum]
MQRRPYEYAQGIHISQVAHGTQKIRKLREAETMPATPTRRNGFPRHGLCAPGDSEISGNNYLVKRTSRHIHCAIKTKRTQCKDLEVRRVTAKAGNETIQEIALRRQVEKLQSELGICKAEKQILESRCQDLEAQLVPNAINIVDLQQEIREPNRQNDSPKEDWAAVSTERDMLYEEKQELEADWASKLYPIEDELEYARYQAEERRLKI